jgi:hypothetical protein
MSQALRARLRSNPSLRDWVQSPGTSCQATIEPVPPGLGTKPPSGSKIVSKSPYLRAIRLWAGSQLLSQTTTTFSAVSGWLIPSEPLIGSRVQRELLALPRRERNSDDAEHRDGS